MNNTPALPLTAAAASTIWSGVGEVKICPGQAASSMPRPTNPACNGSWPEPPPEINATLFAFSERRRTNLRSAPRATMSAWAAAKPSKLSDSMVSTELTNFFTMSLPFAALTPRSILFLQNGGQAVRKFLQQRIDLSVSPGASEIRQVQGEGAIARGLRQLTKPPRMGARVSAQECLLRRRWEVTNFEDSI